MLPNNSSAFYPIFSLSSSSKAIKKSPKPDKSKEQSDIPGLFYIENFIAKSESAALIKEIYKKPWNTSLKRRTQHYGYSYDYKSSHLDFSAKTEPIPEFCGFLLEKLRNSHEVLENFLPDQLIINEYLPGQGIAAHIDKIADFEDIICSISLGSDTIMEFSKDSAKKEVVLLENSLVILTSDARFLWTHGIPARKSDKIAGITQKRGTRVSLTFRKKK